MKKIKILMVLLLTGVFSVSSVSNVSAKQEGATFYFVSSCGNVIIFTVPPSPTFVDDAHNIAIDLNTQDCGPGGPVPKIWMLSPQ